MKKKKRRNGFRFDLKVGRSRTGLGLFAREPIKRGVRIVEYTGRTLKPGEEYTSRSKYLFEVTRTKTIDGAVKSNAARYINHSCAPNCRAENTGRRIYVVSRRRIEPGEELTYNYGKEYFDEHIKRKGCRCTKCEPIELVLD
ncbi:MAG TPA: SET domain-containing protein [Xanthobacteraceae bacterium]|jgi:SET domain-containing protein|nr:SET domain-containing protein [Xanthobacteraceae bacterium]